MFRIERATSLDMMALVPIRLTVHYCRIVRIQRVLRWMALAQMARERFFLSWAVIVCRLDLLPAATSDRSPALDLASLLPLLLRFLPCSRSYFVQRSRIDIWDRAAFFTLRYTPSVHTRERFMEARRASAVISAEPCARPRRLPRRLLVQRRFTPF